MHPFLRGPPGKSRRRGYDVADSAYAGPGSPWAPSPCRWRTRTPGYFCTLLDLGYPTVREVVDNRPDADGVYDRTQFFGSRVISANITAQSPAAELDRRGGGQLRPVHGAERAPRPALRPRAPGRGRAHHHAAGGRLLLAHRRRRKRDIQLQWVAADPVAREASDKTATAWAGASEGGGRTYPLTFNRTYPGGGGAAANGLIVTHGDVAVSPYLRIYGPITGAAVAFVTPAARAIAVPCSPPADRRGPLRRHRHLRTTHGLPRRRPGPAACSTNSTGPTWCGPCCPWPPTSDHEPERAEPTASPRCRRSWQDGYLVMTPAATFHRAAGAGASPCTTGSSPMPPCSPTLLAELPAGARSRRLEQTLNGSATLTFTLDGRTPRPPSSPSWPPTWLPGAGTRSAATTCPISAASWRRARTPLTEQSHVVTFTCHDYLAMLARRYVTGTLTYTNTDQDTIARGLVAVAVTARSTPSPAPPRASHCPRARTCPCTPYSPPRTQPAVSAPSPRDRTYEGSTEILTALDQLAHVIGGFDYDVAPAGRFNATTTPYDSLRIFYPSQGVARAEPVLEYGAAIASLTRSTNSAELRQLRAGAR